MTESRGRPLGRRFEGRDSCRYLSEFDRGYIACKLLQRGDDDTLGRNRKALRCLPLPEVLSSLAEDLLLNPWLLLRQRVADWCRLQDGLKVYLSARHRDNVLNALLPGLTEARRVEKRNHLTRAPDLEGSGNVPGFIWLSVLEHRCNERVEKRDSITSTPDCDTNTALIPNHAMGFTCRLLGICEYLETEARYHRIERSTGER